MKNRWSQDAAERYLADDPVTGLRVYTSQLLGQEQDLVLHGGGNTSVKGSISDIFGDTQRVLYVKGSGWDLGTIASAGFPPTRLDHLLKLSALETLSDSEMMRQLRLSLLDPSAPTPSVEAILHALIPHRYVDHSHADAVVAISNTPDGEAILGELYADEVLVLPYIMPGFILARQVADLTREVDWNRLRGIVLLHHGIFTFSDDARDSYEAMIELVSRAEHYLEKAGATAAIARADYTPNAQDLLRLAALRKQASDSVGSPMLVRWNTDAEAVGFANLKNVEDIACRGPLTPDHTIHAKAFAAIFDDDPLAGLTAFQQRYLRYFNTHADDRHTCLDPVPRYGIWQGKGTLILAPDHKRLGIVDDITRHTLKAIQWSEHLGGWQALPRADLFEVEYWELEQAKLKKAGSQPELQGRVALVTGAASGIGKACVDELSTRGAVVVALDINAEIARSGGTAALGIQCDLTDQDQVRKAVHRTIQNFGGIDMVISNAGNFPPSCDIETMNDAAWRQSMTLNLDSHMGLLRGCIPYLKLGVKPSVVIIASKNVPAPGPGAAAYSVAKAGLTQMARVAALELGRAGIRVNTIHPNAVFDTAVWSEDTLTQRASAYGLSVEEYKRNNVLRTEVTSRDVALAIALLAGDHLAKTTGAQLAVDGGNDRVI
ncbi:MAG: bifunctional aldolase/short-chain dehydrogenase [Pseudohongiellaceae bacterium]